MPGSNKDKLHEYASRLEDIKADLARIMEDIRAGVSTLVQQAQDNQAHQPEDLSNSFAEFEQVLTDFSGMGGDLRTIAASTGKAPATGPTTGGAGGTTATGGSPQTPPAGSPGDANVKSSGTGGGATDTEGIVVGGGRPTGTEGVVVSDGTPTSEDTPPSGASTSSSDTAKP